MEYPELIESCKKAIESGKCLGCTALENINFKGNPNCIYGKKPTVQESINQIWENLGVQERIKL